MNPVRRPYLDGEDSFELTSALLPSHGINMAVQIAGLGVSAHFTCDRVNSRST